MRLAAYYGYTREWWGQAIWFYNKMNKAEVPQDLFEVAEGSGNVAAIPPHYLVQSELVRDWWEQRPGLMETLLPER